MELVHRWMRAVGLVSAGLLWMAIGAAAQQGQPSPVEVERQLLSRLAVGGDVSGLAARAAAIKAKAARESVLPPGTDTAADLNASLMGLRSALRLPAEGESELGERAALEGGTDPAALAAAYEAFQAQDLLLRRELERTAQRLDSLHIGGEVSNRLVAARESLLGVSDRIHAALGEAVAAYRQAQRASRGAAGAGPTRLAAAGEALVRAAGEAREALASVPRSEPLLAPLGAANLPYRRGSLTARAPRLTPTITPSYLDPLAAPPGGIELAGDTQAPLSEAILRQADDLGHDAVRIYEFVRNQIATELYAGAMKGAEGTLAQGSGNDVDQASLLVALLRASLVPARYVRGVVELPVENVAADLGLADPTVVPDLLGRAGLAFRPVIRGGRVAAVQVEHTWVAAYVPYTNYRGAVVDFSGRIWVPLAPAFKHFTVTPSTAVLRAMSYPVAQRLDAYLSTVQAGSLLDGIRQEVEGYLQPTGGVYAEQLGSRAVVSEHLSLLPSSMPGTVVAVTAEEATLSASEVVRVRLIARRGAAEGSAVSLDLELPLAEVAGHRLTLSYTPASVEDHRAVNAWGGLYAVPVYLVELLPQAKLDGRPVGIGTGGLDMGAVHRFEVEVRGPNGTQRVGQSVLAGAYHALTVGAQRAMRPADTGDDPADTERLAARLLSQLGAGYAVSWDAAEDELAGLLDVAVLRPLPSLVVASNAVAVESVLGLPYSFAWKGVTLDASLRAAEPQARRADTAAARDWMKLSALEGSALEQLVFRRDFQVDGISADKGLGLARDGGIEVVHLTSANLATELPALSHPPAVKTEIENWVRQGLTVDVPRTTVQRNAWTGSVWKVEEGATGAAGYFIAGNLAGGSSSEPPESWVLDFLARALAAPYSAEPNTDPLAVAELRKVPAGDGQEGVVGQEFPTQLAVLARDADGRPVFGAQVVFQVSESEGTVIGPDGTEGPQVVAATDELGIARVTLKAGQHTDVNPVYAVQNPSDRYYTQALAHTIEVVAPAHDGVVPVSAPFEALAYPDVPQKLARTSAPRTYGREGLWADTLRVQVQDQYDNPLSNVDVTFSVGSAQFNCDPPPAGFQNAVVFDFATCAVGVPHLGDCGSGSFTTTASLRGAFAGVILGNATATVYNVSVSAAGLTNLSVSYEDPSSCDASPLTVFNTSFLSDEFGANIQATRAGQQFQRPIPITLLYEWPDYEVKTDSEGHCYIEYKPMRSWRPTTGSLSFNVANGGSASGAAYFGDHYETLITTGLTPAENTITFTAANVVMEYPRVDSQSCAESVGQRTVTINGSLPSVYGLMPTVQSSTPDPIVLSETGNSVEPVTLQYLNMPADYRALFLEVLLYENGAQIGRAVGSTRSGAGNVSIQRGFHFDVQKTYEAELVANRGTLNEARSDRFALPLYQRIFTRVSRSVTLSQFVDLLNDRVCAFGSDFRFTTTQPARVTLAFRKIESSNTDGSLNLGSETKLIDDQLYGVGDQQLTIVPTDLLPGDYLFELSGVSEVDGHMDSVNGAATSEFRTEDSLPVGHAIYKGVDLFDGHLAVVRQDLAVPGRGRSLELIRSYSSNGTKEPGPFGIGWGHNYDSKVIVTQCGEVIVIGAEGGGMRFVDDGAGGLKPLKGYHGTLVANHADSSWDFYSKDGTHYHYAFAQFREWLLDYIEDTNGNRTTLAYDRSGIEPKLVSVTDPGGRSLHFTYERRFFMLGAQDVVTGIEGPGGLTMTYEYDSAGNLTRAAREGGVRAEAYTYPDTQTAPFETRNDLASITDEVTGGTTSFTYMKAPIGLQGNVMVPSTFVSSMVEPQGGSDSFEFDTAALGGGAATTLTSRVTNRRGSTLTYVLNRYGSPLSISDGAGHTVEMSWAADDVVMTSRTDENGSTTTLTNDENANLLSASLPVSDFDGASHVYTQVNTWYSEGAFGKPGIKDRQASSTNRNGVRTDFTYDGRGNLTAMSITSGGYSETFTYGPNGDRRTRTDANGHTTSFTYDAYGYPVTATDPLGGVTRTAFDVLGRQVAKTDPNGHTTSYQYDTLNRVTQTSYPGGFAESTVYDDAARTTTLTDVLGRHTVTALDFEQHPLSIVDALGNRKEYSYDPEGALSGESNWFGGGTARADTSYGLDGAGRTTSKSEPLGKTTAYTLDGVGNITRETLSGPGLSTPHVTEYGYDALNRRHTERRLNSGGDVTTHQRYDGEGNVVAEIDPLGGETQHTFDALDRKRSFRNPLGGTTSYTYDAVGNRLTETDPLNHTRRQEYDALGRVTRKVDALNNAWLYEYDAVGNLLREIDPRLHETTYSYDSRDRRTSKAQPVTLGLGAVGSVTTTFVYDAAGNLTETRQPNGNVEVQTYDGLNRLLSRTDNLGAVLSRTYDANGNMLTETDGNGATTTRTFDALNRPTREEMPEGRTQTYTWDVAGNRLSRVDPRGFTTQYVYDDVNRLRQTIDPAEVGTTLATTYDAAGRVATETDRRGLVTTHVRDALGRPTQIIDPPAVGTSRSFTYDAVGNRLTETDRRGIVTTYTYDNENRQATTRRAGVTVRRLEYDKAGNVRFDTDANGNIVGFEYDERNLRVAENRPLAAITQYGLDAMGDVVLQRDPEGRTTRWTRDVRRRILTETDGAGATSTYTYDGNGNKRSTRRPEGATWGRDYDDAGRLVRLTNGAGDTTEYGYDGNGNRTSVTDGRTRLTQFEFDALNRMTALVYPDGAREERVLDGAGNVLELHTPKGQVATFTYDGLNRPTASAYTPALPSVGDDLLSRSRTYDGNGNPLTVVDTYSGATGTRTTTATFDDFDRLAAITNGDGKALSYSYDANGNRTQLRDPDNRLTTYTYDANNRLTSVTVPLSGVSQYEYFRNSLLKRLVYPNGTEARYTYDLANRVATIDNKQGAAVVSSYTYGYDGNGNRTQQVEVNGAAAETTTYQFDDADRLAGVDYPDQRVRYTYDEVGNRLSENAEDLATNPLVAKSFTYDDRNRLTRVDDLIDGSETATYGYDANGNQTSKTLGGLTDSFFYDNRDQLVEVQHDGVLAGRYLYDHNGLRVKKAGSGQDLRYVYDDHSVLLETDGSGSTLARYEYGPDRLLSMIHATEGRQFYLFDALKSVVNLTKPDGTVQARYRYDAWGNPRSTVGASFNPFGFTSQERDAESGLYYFKARYYDPTIGRFLSQDPAKGDANSPPSLHKYLYANANPTAFIDPTGLYAESGHYYTVYYVALKAGYSVENAQKLAYFTQLPDEVARLDAIAAQGNYLLALGGAAQADADLARMGRESNIAGEIRQERTTIQQTFHSLTGNRNADEETRATITAIRGAGSDLATTGLLLHRLADTFAHREIDNDKAVYATGFGHAGDGVSPDKVLRRPDIYLDYVRTLYSVLAEKNGRTYFQRRDDLAALAPLGSSEGALPKNSGRDLTRPVGREGGGAASSNQQAIQDEVQSIIRAWVREGKQYYYKSNGQAAVRLNFEETVTRCATDDRCLEKAFQLHIKRQVQAAGGDVGYVPEEKEVGGLFGYGILWGKDYDESLKELKKESRVPSVKTDPAYTEQNVQQAVDQAIRLVQQARSQQQRATGIVVEPKNEGAEHIEPTKSQEEE